MRVFEAPFKTTRGALERTLLVLGYTPSFGKNEFGFPFVEYHHEDSGALIALRSAPADEPIYDGDLLRAEHSVEWFGVASRDQFYILLQQQTSEEVKAA